MPTNSLSNGRNYVPKPVSLHSPSSASTIERDYDHYRNDFTPTSSPADERRNGKNPTKKHLKEVSTKTKWSTRKKIIVGFAIALVCILIIMIIVLAVVLTRGGATTTATTTTMTTTTTTTATVISVYWMFDLDTSDVYGRYNGSLVNSATYTASSSTQPYVGNGRALYLPNPPGSSTNSLFSVSSFFNLSYQSFTVEAWIYAITAYSGDNGILGQCSCPTCPNQCLQLIVRSGRLYMGFSLNDLVGTTTLSVNTWYHVAFVYDYTTLQQIIYLNGVQESIKSSAQPYQGQSGVILIGATQLLSQTSYFNGYIDNVKVTTRAKTSTEILDDATLMAYYSFDLPNQLQDRGPNGLNGVQRNTALVTGRVNEGLRFTGSNSFFQAFGFYSLAWGVVSNRPFTIALWVNPTTITSSTIVQVSPFQNSSFNPAYIMNLIGFWSSGGTNNGQLVTQLYNWPSVFGPFLPLNTWTHVTFTFSTTAGNTQYVNGVLIGSTGATSSGNVYNYILWLHIGYSFCWSSPYIPCTGYQGSVDEVYIYNRELNQSEITVLANP